jgi:hypothetical protein
VVRPGHHHHRRRRRRAGVVALLGSEARRRQVGVWPGAVLESVRLLFSLRV